MAEKNFMVKIESLEKYFGEDVERVHVLKGVSLEIPEGSLYTFLGPSGCGKTTLLRCIVGLEAPDTGEISIGDEVVWSKEKNISIPPEKRGLGMVFQTYAIWPHMDVFDNVAYPLQVRDVGKDIIRERVAKALRFLHIQAY